MSGAIEHIAGRMVSGVQRCARCSDVLADYRTSESRNGWAALAWQEGARVIVAGRCMMVATDERADHGAQPCSAKATA